MKPLWLELLFPLVAATPLILALSGVWWNHVDVIVHGAYAPLQPNPAVDIAAGVLAILGMAVGVAASLLKRAHARN